jgi:hypothetical protein
VNSVLDQAIANLLSIAKTKEFPKETIANFWAVRIRDDSAGSHKLLVRFSNDCPNPKVILWFCVASYADLQLPTVFGFVKTSAGRVSHHFVVRLHLMKGVKIRVLQSADK